MQIWVLKYRNNSMLKTKTLSSCWFHFTIIFCIFFLTKFMDTLINQFNQLCLLSASNKLLVIKSAFFLHQHEHLGTLTNNNTPICKISLTDYSFLLQIAAFSKRICHFSYCHGNNLEMNRQLIMNNIYCA